MFPDIARDDIFRLETRRLWLRWPRATDAAAISRYCSLWEVARYTARIPHPYLPGTADRFIFAAREANALGRDLTLVITATHGRREPFGAISLERRGSDRLTLGYALNPTCWGKGFATEAAAAIVDAAFSLTAVAEIDASVRLENVASRRVLEKIGMTFVSRGRQGAPARGGLVESVRFLLSRADWRAGRAALEPVTAELEHEIS
jgi:RimJ/RimL family protein N-acetyltransferase